jgi:hypothetical protein
MSLTASVTFQPRGKLSLCQLNYHSFFICLFMLRGHCERSEATPAFGVEIASQQSLAMTALRNVSCLYAYANDPA